MELHKLLTRQLNRLELNDDTPPSTPEKWKAFLNRINQTYLEGDQERYLSTRATEISSRELFELNEKLENAQHIAHLGYWFHDKTSGKISVSNELLHLLGPNPHTTKYTFEQFIESVHKDDRQDLVNTIEKAFSEGQDYEREIRIKHFNGKYHWYHIIGHPPQTGENTQLSGIAMDITRRKEAEKEVALLNQKLITTARQAGIADIATSILHNVGNVLNSANVSLDVLNDTTKEPYFKKLITILEMLKEHQNTITNYLTADPKGQLIPEYLIEILDILKAEDNTYTQEIANLSTHLQQIKEIVAMQQNFSGISGIIQKIFVPEIIDTAIQISGYGTFSKHIQIKKIYKQTPFITTDQTKLLQILSNLIRNAKESVMDNHRKIQKKITLSIDYDPSHNKIVIEVTDNGVGIAQENLIKIFSFGFTTKPNGHGVGLNSCAIAAKELGSTLVVESKGIGQGATFILKIPINNIKPERKIHDSAS